MNRTEFKNCALSSNYMHQAKVMMISFGVVLTAMVVAFCRHY